MTEESEPRSAVHLLVSEAFFLDKLEGTLTALGRQPIVPDWGKDLQEQVLAEPAMAIVIDLENEEVEMLSILQKFRAHPQIREIPTLAYCSHGRNDLVQQVEQMGVQVVLRSTFAANLVRLLMDLGASGEGPTANPGAAS